MVMVHVPYILLAVLGGDGAYNLLCKPRLLASVVGILYPVLARFCILKYARIVEKALRGRFSS